MLEKIHPDLRTLALPIGDLNEDPNNANTHSAASHESIAGSFLRFGQRKPIVVRHEGMVVEAGNGTLVLTAGSGFTGTTTVSTGALEIQSGTGLGTTDGATTVADGAALKFWSGSSMTVAEDVTITGTGVGGIDGSQPPPTTP